MQIYFLTRGHYDQVNRFINDLLAQKYDREYKGKGKFKIGWHVRPIQLWEIAVPREEMDKVLGTLEGSAHDNIPSSLMWAFRKALKLKPVNRVISPTFLANKGAVQVVVIGYREDRTDENFGLEVI